MINIKDTLNKLFHQEILSKEEAKSVLHKIGRGEVDESQTAALLTTFRMRPITSVELSGFREAMIDLSLVVDLDDYETVDLCGTGGDGKNTFNISTLASIVVAGAGYKVAKHGNSGKSSVCGSSNVLEALGYEMTNKEDILRSSIERSNFCYMHAPLFHPAMKEVIMLRRGLGFPTFFNILGPLLNPAQPSRQLTGVANEDIIPLYKGVFDDIGSQYAVVHSLHGHDEISLTGSFRLCRNDAEYTLSPEDIGLDKVIPKAITGGNTIEEAVKIFTKIAKGEGTIEQENVVCANAAYTIQLFKPDSDISDCILEAKESIRSGEAYSVIKSFQK